ncbi:hypothetical protein LX64_00545 [Chitinophaga skermanii]|uniref:Uncharacterized protein n=1 Tax=Chitinophaga skermanii TaxID=331697 RepID=A0A327R4F3_9BACT|nr:hypothetical protein LX64_00545 [Chitinophaga skermanii]
MMVCFGRSSGGGAKQACVLACGRYYVFENSAHHRFPLVEAYPHYIEGLNNFRAFMQEANWY